MLKQYYKKSILLFIVCSFLVEENNAQNWEVDLLKNINSATHQSTYWKTANKSVYPISIASPITILSIGYLKKDKQLQQQGWQNIGALVINTVITQGLKYAINRERPYDKYPTIIYPYQVDNDPSFPSGHTSTAFTTATTLSIHFKKWYVVVPAYTWAASVGYARLYLGEHYPTDVVAGAIIGTGSAFLSQWIIKKYFQKKKKTINKF